MHVYVISADEEGPCKIGIAKSPENRRKQLQVGNPRQLVVAYQKAVSGPEMAQRVERAAHTILLETRLQGEWFSSSVPEAISAVNGALESPAPKPKKQISVISQKEFVPFHPLVPDRLRNMQLRDMTEEQRLEYWDCFGLDHPGEGFDDWYIVGSAKSGVCGAIPVVGFTDEEDDG